MILYAAGADGPGLRRFRFWSAPIPGGPRLLCLPPGPVLFWTGRRSACPGAVDHAAVAGGADDGGPGPASPGLAMPWRIPPALELERVSLDRWSWSASAGAARPACRLPPPVRPCLAPRRGEVPRRGGEGPPPVRPPRFSPRFPAGISPVTRAAGDSPAHNARPRRFPA